MPASVLIVGAGIAGLSCGYHFKSFVNNKVELDIFEARGKAGGRTQQLVDAPFIDPNVIDLDMGGQDLFFAERDEYERLLKGSADRNAFNNDFVNEPWTSADTLLACDTDGPPCVQKAFNRSLDEASFKDASLASFVSTFLLPPVDADVSLNTEVTIIDYTDINKIVVTTAGGGEPEEYDQLVVAVPLSTLQASNITFIPPLHTDFSTPIQSQPIFTGVRIWIEFTTDFYSDSTWFVDGFPNENRYWNAVKGYGTNKNILTIQGNRNEYLVNMSDDEIKDKVLADLDAAYNGLASTYYVDHYVRNYKNEKYIEMSTKNSKEIPNIEIFKKPLDGRIWFAGDYTRRGDAGNEAGDSGMEVAKWVRNKFRCKKSCKNTNQCCKNNNKWKYDNDADKDCDWVAEDRFNRCSLIGKNGNGANKKAKIACKRACKECLGVCPL